MGRLTFPCQHFQPGIANQEMEMNQATMKKSPAVQLEAPRFENGKALVIAGLRSRYTTGTMNGIPAQWQRFGPHLGNIPGQMGRVAYGLCFNALSPDGIDYLAGVEVSSSSGLPGDFSVVTIPAQNTPFSPTANTFPNSVKRRMPSTSGFRDPALRLPTVSLKRQAFSSVIPRSSIRGPEWVAWRFGYQSNCEGS